MLQYRVDDKTKEILGNELWTAPSKFLSKSSCILDLGGGPGLFAAQLKTKDNLVVSIDSTRQTLFLGNTIHPSIEPVCGDALHLPFKDSSFDTILIRAVLHHFPDQLNDAFYEIFRVLKPNGQILIEEPGHYNPLACIIRKTISTTSHESKEEPLIPSRLIKIVEQWFSITEVKYYYLLSYGTPNIVGLMPDRFKPALRKIVSALVRIDKKLVQFKLFYPLCGYLLIVCIKE